jgi:hypothetical protein
MSEVILVCFSDKTNSEHGGMYYPGILDTIKADETRSGCRVWCISDRSLPCKNFIPLESCCKSVNELKNKIDRNRWRNWGLLGLKRNLVIWDFINSRSDLTWPIFPMDNDIPIFSNLEEVYKPLLNNDFCSSIYNKSELYPGGTAGAYSIHNMECFQAGIDLLLSSVLDDLSLTDMTLWSKIYQSGKWKVGNILSKFDGGGAFDSNMHVSEDRYVMEPSTVPMWGLETKKITWKDGHPYFTELLDGSLTIAHWIHCWGSYKLRTKELIEKAGL